MSSTVETDDSVTIVDLRTSDDSGLVATGIEAPSLRWRLKSDREGIRQLGYEVQVCRDPDFLSGVHSSGFTAGHSLVNRPWPSVPLASRQVQHWRVRVWTERGPTEWSVSARLEAGLFESSDWFARPISAPPHLRNGRESGVVLLRKEFIIEQAILSARLYVSALGLHDTYINGRRVTEDLLEPGWTAYEKRLLYAAYDVTSFLAAGRNVVCSQLGEGWWARDVRSLSIQPVYGTEPSFFAQLEVQLTDRNMIMVGTDGSWKAGVGALKSASLFNGVDVDLRCEPTGWQIPGFDDDGWSPVAVGGLPKGLVMRSAPPVRVVEERSCLLTPKQHVWLVDVGQNIAGYLRLRVRGRRGAVVSVRHAELLDVHGELNVAPLRTARAVDNYVLADESLIWLAPTFTYHGFRYAEIQLDDGLTIEDVSALVVSSSQRSTGIFQCSDPQVNRLFQNVLWSQRANFISIPTDCPQRDERLGWTGDIQVFARTACMNFDVRAFLGSWLEDLALEQRADGCVPSIVPNVIRGHAWEFGGAGWGDAATVVPWTLYEHYGDEEILKEQFSSMRSWVDWCASRRETDGTWTSDRQLGDWLDPSAPAAEPHRASTDPNYIATSYLSWSAGIVSKAATILGDHELASCYRTLQTLVAAAAWRRWGSHAVTTQTGCAVALQFEIAPASARSRVADHLVRLVERGGGRIGTGFLGTPLILQALTEAGEAETAYRILLNTQCPGWLYQVRLGATTMWERWDAVKPDGALQSGQVVGVAEKPTEMVSFNHYAFGAIGSWLYQTVAGIRPTVFDPGYSTIVFAPVPAAQIQHARAQLETPYGRASIEWKIEAAALQVRILVPPGAKAWFVPPLKWRSQSGSDAPCQTPPYIPPSSRYLGSGQHVFVLIHRP